MGLHIHSLEAFPLDTPDRDYFLYLLDYGWSDNLLQIVNANFTEMAKQAATNRAAIIRGTEIGHWSNHVLSWHHINGVEGEKILPAILLTNSNPWEFRQINSDIVFHAKGGIRSYGDLSFIIIPLRDTCQEPTDVSKLISSIFADIRRGEVLKDFEISKKMERGIGQAIIDGLILKPSVHGIGFDVKTFFKKLRKN